MRTESRTENTSAKAASYRPDIDGLRAIAVLGVVAFHSGLPYFPGGFVGVDVFFVISGFLITGLLSAEFEQTGSINFSNFFVRRIRRLLPALALVVTVTLAIAMFSMFPLELHRLGKSAQAVATLVANIHFKNFSGGYFDPSTDVMPLLHTWSLAVEEQYYLGWPILFLLAHKLWQPERNNPHLTTIATLLLVLILSFVACVWMTGHNRSAAFYLTPYRAWEFAAGALLSYGAAKIRDRLPGYLGDGFFLAGLGAILATMVFYDDRIQFPGIIALVPVIGSVAVIAGGCSATAKLPSRLLGNRLMVGIGLISYSLYLWHWPLLALARDYALGSRELGRDLGVVAMSFVLAWLTYRYVENPIRHYKPGAFATRRGSFRIGFLMSFFLVVAANGVMDYTKGKNAELNAMLRDELAKQGIPSTQTNMATMPVVLCDQRENGPNRTVPSTCNGGNLHTPVRIVAWGDSHASQLAPMLNDFSSRHGIASLVRSMGTCPPLRGAIPVKRSEGQFGCGHFNDLVFGEISAEEKKGLRGVVLGARWNVYMALPVTEPGGTYPFALASNWNALEQNPDATPEVGLPPLDPEGSAATLAASLRETLITLDKLGLRVLIVTPVPELYFNAMQCLYRHTPEQCTVLRSKVEARRLLAMAAIQSAARGLGNVRLFDPIDEFCDASVCYAKRNGLTLYGDDNHISAAMAMQLGKRMDPLLKWVASVD